MTTTGLGPLSPTLAVGLPAGRREQTLSEEPISETRAGKEGKAVPRSWTAGGTREEGIWGLPGSLERECPWERSPGAARLPSAVASSHLKPFERSKPPTPHLRNGGHSGSYLVGLF